MIKLRDYQERAVSMLRDSISSGHKRPIVVLSTGAGKSIIFGQVISLAVSKGSTCLFLVHRRNLVFQFRDTLVNFFGIDAGVIMAGEKFDTGKDVYVATMQTYSRRMNLEDLGLNRFFIDADIILVDEAHLSLSKTYMDIFKAYEDKILIGTTATPMRSDQRGLGEVYDDLLDVVGTRELTDGGYLAPVKYYVPSEIDLSKIHIKMGDYDKKEIAEKVDTAKIVGDVVENWMKFASGRKTIVFAVNVKHSMHLCDEFNKVGIPAYHLDAKSDDSERLEAFGKMERGEIKIICNVALYQEGMDVPDISCVVMARPTKSIGLYRQCAGRGMRISKDFKDLVFLDHGGVVEEHGLLTDEVEWSLDGKEKAWKKNKKREKEKKMLKCQACHEVFEGAGSCPSCGSPVKTFGRDVGTVAGELKEITGKKKKFSMAEKRRWYAMELFYAREKGWSDGAAAHKYREKVGCWPRGMKHIATIKPDSDFLSYKKHLAIKWAKSRENRKNEI